VRITARFNKKGFSFIEVLVALAILMVAMMGILGAMVMAMQQNLETYSRDESVRIAEQAMNELRNTSFETLANGNYDVTRTYKQYTKTFNVVRTVTPFSDNSASVQLQVSWTVNKKVHTHSVTSIISQGI
jgi:type IV pilus assembly protein PilV